MTPPVDLFGEAVPDPVSDATDDDNLDLMMDAFDAEDAPEDATGIIKTPAETFSLYGHAAAEAYFVDRIQGGTMPHGVILTGPPGIGKTTFAYRLARALLSMKNGEQLKTLSVSEQDVAARRLIAGSHPDFMHIARSPSPKTGKMRTEIVVEDVRKVEPFLRMKSATNGWRAVIIEHADEMNIESQNALLKILEEPPAKAVLMLVTARPGAFLPTIRSRCRVVQFDALSSADVDSALQSAFPALSTYERESITSLACGSIGKAFSLAEGAGLQTYAQMLDFVGQAPHFNPLKLHELADIFHADEKMFTAYTAMLIDFLNRLISATAKGEPFSTVIEDEDHITQGLIDHFGGRRLLETRDAIVELLARHDRALFDRRQVTFQIFNAFPKV